MATSKKGAAGEMSVANTQEVNAELNSNVKELEAKKRNLAASYKNEPKVTVQGSPMYRPYFGNNMAIIVNGIAIYVPLDGQQYSIPESFAAVFFERISRTDEQIRMRKQMSSVPNNLESYAGERGLIKRA